MKNDINRKSKVDCLHKVSRQDEGPNSTFTKFPAKMRVRIQLYKVSRQDEGPNSTFKFPATHDERVRSGPIQAR